MKHEILDARGLDCPLPVVKTRDKLKNMGEGVITILVSTEVQKDNVHRLLVSAGCTNIEIEAKPGEFSIRATVPAVAAMVEQAPEEEQRPGRCTGPVIFVRRDSIGAGDDQLGRILARAFCTTLPMINPLPAAMVFMNGGVRLAAVGAETVAPLQRLAQAGVKLLVCGTCLDYFKLKDKLAVGTVSNMFDITETLFKAASVISL